ncbi:RHS repeat domain-containing protein [Pseudoxanthomonas sp. 22568]|uniref:RHS repeat domain-containing protein n=1 Tax=Pseudoxanthomonas sp. 22568 TaxID=3453945 RepID=UPI003F856B2B
MKMNARWKASLGTLLCLMLWSLWAGAQAQTVRYVHTDALGSVVLMTDASRNVVERNEYEPYGRVLTQPVNDGPGYTGHVQDAATGLTYMQQRYYDPLIGRFLSVDPVTPYSGGIASFNRYWYAGGNPYRFVDPDGRGVWDRIRAAMFPVGTELAQRGEAGTAGSNSIGAAKQIANSMIDAGATMANPTAKLLGVAPPRFQINNNELEGAAGAEFGIVAAGAVVGGGVGSAGKGTVIIGETMVRVELAAARTPGAKILNDMPDFGAMGMKPHQVTSAMMQYNRKWILEQMRSGRQIMDIGPDPNRATPSIFYQMERRMLENYQKIHPEYPGATQP